jgi:prevent-host-death family protein
MNSMNISEAPRRLSHIVAAAERGQTTILTRRGRPVAQIAPVAKVSGKALPDLSKFRASLKVKGKPLSAVVIQRRKAERY